MSVQSLEQLPLCGRSSFGAVGRFPGAWAPHPESLSTLRALIGNIRMLLLFLVLFQLCSCPQGARTVLHAVLSLFLSRVYGQLHSSFTMAFWYVWMGAPMVTAAAVLADLRSWRGAPLAAVPALQDPFRQQPVLRTIPGLYAAKVQSSSQGVRSVAPTSCAC